MPKDNPPSTKIPSQAPPLDPTDIEATPLLLRNPGLAPGTVPERQGRQVQAPMDAGGLDNNYASNGHWDRDDLGPIAYVPPVEAHEDDGPRTGAAGQAPAQQGGPGARPRIKKDRT